MGGQGGGDLVMEVVYRSCVRVCLCVFVVKACILLFVRCEVVTNIMCEHSIQNASQNV